MRNITLICLCVLIMGIVIDKVFIGDYSSKVEELTNASFANIQDNSAHRSMGNVKPICPVMMSPEEDEFNVPTQGGTSVSFISSGSPIPRNYCYIYYGTDPKNLNRSAKYAVSGNGYVGVVLNLDPNTKYFWVVTETNPQSETSQCELQSFRTSAFCPSFNLSIGDACDDGNKLTINDTVSNDCLCRGDSIDFDGDLVLDNMDNCAEDYNPEQLDQDEDGIGNLCDSDIDGDGRNNESDCAPYNAELLYGASCSDGNEATSFDSINGSCICEGLYADSDYDGILDDEDNCLLHPNACQEDFDQDGVGDCCDIDINGDGFLINDDCIPEDETFFLGDPCDVFNELFVGTHIYDGY